MVSRQRTVYSGKSTGRRWRLFLGAVLFLGVLALCAWYFRLTTTPMSGFDYSPSKDTARWQFSLEDGTVIDPADGQLPLNGTDATVICRTPLTDALSAHPCFVVTANYSDCAIFINDSLIYAPSGRFSGGQFTAFKYIYSPASLAKTSPVATGSPSVLPDNDSIDRSFPWPYSC